MAPSSLCVTGRTMMRDRPVWEVRARDAVGGGRGVFLTQDVKCGALIIVEAPFYSYAGSSDVGAASVLHVCIARDVLAGKLDTQAMAKARWAYIGYGLDVLTGRCCSLPSSTQSRCRHAIVSGASINMASRWMRCWSSLPGARVMTCFACCLRCSSIRLRRACTSIKASGFLMCLLSPSDTPLQP